MPVLEPPRWHSYLIHLGLKFWDTRPSECDGYFALQRECQNAAILQMIETQLKQATDPILVYAHPVTEDDAEDNLFAFADEELHKPPPLDDMEMAPIPAFPSSPKCYGWLPFNRRVVQNIPRALWPPVVRLPDIQRSLASDKDYTAIVYDYIENVDNNPAEVEAVDTFLWLAGFCHKDTGARNWKGGVLVDHSAIVHPRAFGWQKTRYRRRKAPALLYC